MNNQEEKDKKGGSNEQSSLMRMSTMKIPKTPPSISMYLFGYHFVRCKSIHFSPDVRGGGILVSSDPDEERLVGVPESPRPRLALDPFSLKTSLVRG